MSKEKKGLLDDVSLAIESSFALDTLTLKKDFAWHLRLLIQTLLPRTYSHYNVTMTFDSSPYSMRLAALDDRLKRAQTQPSLGDDMEGDEVSTIKQEMEDVRKAQKELEAKCDTIEFEARVEEMKYNDKGTLLTMLVPEDSIEELNEHKMLYRHYSISLEPVF